MKLLVSARSTEEALAAAAAGADFIDLKEPSAGALGALPLETIREAVTALRARHPGRPVSATVGDFGRAARAGHPGTVRPGLTDTPLDTLEVETGGHLEALHERVRLTAACGVDYVKVGLFPGDDALLQALAGSRAGAEWAHAAIVPVLIADAGIDEGLLAQALELPFPALMLDTNDKDGGSLLDRNDEAPLRQFVHRCRARGRLSGLAGALRAAELRRLQAIAPDFAGFRSAVCAGTRRDDLDAVLVRALRLELDGRPDVAMPAA